MMRHADRLGFSRAIYEPNRQRANEMLRGIGIVLEGLAILLLALAAWGVTLGFFVRVGWLLAARLFG